jgi:Family of unknown function (DUF5990)
VPARIVLRFLKNVILFPFRLVARLFPREPLARAPHAGQTAAVDVRIVGTDLPGRRCADPRPDGLVYENVHVGVQRRQEVIDLVPGDAPNAEWNRTLEPSFRDGEPDFRGPFAQGRRGDRFLYLSWGSVNAGGHFEMFRRAKLMLDAVTPELVQAADRLGHRLLATLGLTDARDGMPRCAAVRPPLISWSVGTT